MDSHLFIAYFNAQTQVKNARIWIADCRKNGFIQIWGTRIIKQAGLIRTVSSFKSFPATGIKQQLAAMGVEAARYLSGVLDELALIKAYD